MLIAVAPWLFAAAAALAGWLTPSQIAITMALEVVVAMFFAKQRIALSRGPLTKTLHTIEDNTSVYLPPGTYLNAQQLKLYSGKGHGILLALAMLGTVGIVLMDLLRVFTHPASLVLWLVWSATLVVSEYVQHRRWLRSDAAATADPTSHAENAEMTAFALICAASLLFLLVHGRPLALALLLFDGGFRLWAHRIATARTARNAAAPITHQRLQAPDPTWVPEPGWTPPQGSYGPLPGWERQTPDGAWRRTAEHPWGAT